MLKPKQARMDLEKGRRINGSEPWICMIATKCRSVVNKTKMVATIDQGDFSAYCAAADKDTFLEMDLRTGDASYNFLLCLDFA
jgi:hypothetical protein